MVAKDRYLKAVEAEGWQASLFSDFVWYVKYLVAITSVSDCQKLQCTKYFMCLFQPLVVLVVNFIENEVKHNLNVVKKEIF
jgi:hypothetical protein